MGSKMAPCARLSRSWLVLALSAMGIGLGAPASRAQNPGLNKIDHLIVIYQENWSFDGLYGRFPGADGLVNAGDPARQTMKDGTPYGTLLSFAKTCPG